MGDKSDVWMALYIGAYLADTMHLGRQHHGSYLLLIMAAFKNAGWLPNDDGLLAQVAKCTPKEWRAERAVYAAFFQVSADRWTHKRVTLEWEKAQSLTAQRSAGGSKGAAKRWGKQRQSDRSAMAQPQPGQWQNDGPSEEPTPSVTPTLSVSDSAQARGATHSGWAAPIPDDWEPSGEALQRLRVGRPDLVGPYYDQRMLAFRAWCKAKAITTHNFEASWMGFMVQSHAAPTGAPGGAESWNERRIREGMEALSK